MTKQLCLSLSLLTGAFILSVLPPCSRYLPASPVTETVRTVCSKCHPLDRLTNGRTPQEWRNILTMMVVNYGAPIPPDQMPAISDYIIKNFPDRSPKPVLIPGKVQIDIKEWTVPTEGAWPHDPLAAPDGSIWYTGQMASLLGRFDPKTEKFKEYPLTTPKSGP